MKDKISINSISKQKQPKKQLITTNVQPLKSRSPIPLSSIINKNNTNKPNKNYNYNNYDKYYIPKFNKS